MKPLETLLKTFIELHPDKAARAFESLTPADAHKLFGQRPLKTIVSPGRLAGAVALTRAELR